MVERDDSTRELVELVRGAGGEELGGLIAEILAVQPMAAVGPSMAAVGPRVGLIKEFNLEVAPTPLRARLAGEPRTVAVGLIFALVVRRMEVPEALGPWDLDTLHEDFFNGVLHELDAFGDAGRTVVEALLRNDWTGLRARSLAEGMFLGAMDALYRACESACPPVDAQGPSHADRGVALKYPHRVLFDVWMRVLRAWVDYGSEGKVLGREPAKLYGGVVADLWRSRSVALIPLVVADLGEWIGDGAGSLRPSFVPLQLREVLRLGQRLFSLAVYGGPSGP